LEPHLELVTLDHKQVIHERNSEIKNVYFPISGVISWIIIMRDGNCAEAMTIGREGVAGLQVVLGGNAGSSVAVVQAAGEALRIGKEDFCRILSRDETLSKTMNLYCSTFINAMAQCAACNRLHETTERCARWLLMMHDRSDGDEFTLVQEFLADMLGVRRPSVSVCASILQRAGYISYKRGKVRIEDRKGLESASCECYEILRDEYDALEGALKTTVGARTNGRSPSARN